MSASRVIRAAVGIAFLVVVGFGLLSSHGSSAHAYSPSPVPSTTEGTIIIGGSTLAPSTTVALSVGGQVIAPSVGNGTVVTQPSSGSSLPFTGADIMVMVAVAL